LINPWSTGQCAENPRVGDSIPSLQYPKWVLRSENPLATHYANELIALACSGSGAVQRELAQLEAAELVTVRRVANQKHYQANASAPIFKELGGLVLKTSGLPDVLRAALAH
jgi:hypothetical protein